MLTSVTIMVCSYSECRKISLELVTVEDDGVLQSICNDIVETCVGFLRCYFSVEIVFGYIILYMYISPCE